MSEFIKAIGIFYKNELNAIKKSDLPWKRLTLLGG